MGAELLLLFKFLSYLESLQIHCAYVRLLQNQSAIGAGSLDTIRENLNRDIYVELALL